MPSIQIKTIVQQGETSFKEKGSQFIGQAYPAASEEESSGILQQIRKKHYDATHHCYAMKFQDSKFKYSDDGEPGGTAGIRIYNAVEHFGLVNLLVVVIRYYGGVKLGVGPLGKAYYQSAYDVLEQCPVVIKTGYLKGTIEAGFDFISHVHRVTANNSAKITGNEYTNKALFTILAEPYKTEDIKSQLTELSRGDIKINFEDDIIYL